MRCLFSFSSLCACAQPPRKGTVVNIFVFTLPYLATIPPVPAVQLHTTPQQRHLPLLSPHVRHNGGCSRLCRRLLWLKIRNSAARPVLPAAPFGDNSANFANQLYKQFTKLFSIFLNPNLLLSTQYLALSTFYILATFTAVSTTPVRPSRYFTSALTVT